MSCTVAPDVTTRSLSVQNAETSNPGLMMTHRSRSASTG